MTWLLLALTLTSAEKAEHQLYLANGHFFAGDMQNAKRSLDLAQKADPNARVRCKGVRLPVQLAGRMLEICDPDKAGLPDAVEFAVRKAIARKDLEEVGRLDPFRFNKRQPVLMAAD